MRFEVEPLVAAVRKVMPTAKGKHVAIYQSICFRGGKVLSYDGTSGTIVTCPLGGMEFCVDAGTFSKVLRALDAVELEITQTDGWIHIEGGAFKTDLPTQLEFEFPDVIPKKPVRFCAATNLVEALGAVKYSIETDLSKVHMCGVGLRGAYAYSLDGKRITRTYLNAPVSAPVSISKSAIDQIISFGQPDYLFQDGTNIGALYASERTIVVSRMLEGNFPFDHVDMVFAAAKDDACVLEIPSGLEEAIKRVSMMLPKDDSRLDLSLEQDQLKIKAVAGTTEETVPWVCGLTFQARVKGSSLLGALQKLKPLAIDLTDVISGDKRSLRFFADGTEHVMALCV